MSEPDRWEFEVRDRDSGKLLAEGDACTEAEAKREGMHYAVQYAMGGEPCMLTIKPARSRSK